ncbi:MAG: hypothetical protein ING26_04365 [Roseomonas sp.]|nr:hypothetical protein [Roseomonas sp.]MCA3299717.1 hypothetical protein [Roseomonas sp.]
MRRYRIFASFFVAFFLAACAVGPITERVFTSNFLGNVQRVLIVNILDPGTHEDTVASFREEMRRALGTCGIETSDLNLHRMMLNRVATMNAAVSSFGPDLILTIGITGTVVRWPSSHHTFQVTAAPPGGEPIFQVFNFVMHAGGATLGKGLAEKAFNVGKDRIFRSCSAIAPRAAGPQSYEAAFEKGEA